MTRHVAAIGLGLILSVANSDLALAQSPFKPTQSVIVNDSSQPVPVTVESVAPERPTVVCSLETGSVGTTGPFLNSLPNANSAVLASAAVKCPNGVSTVDVRRIAFVPDVSFFGTTNVAKFRVVVGFSDDLQMSPIEIRASLTDGAAEGAVMQPLRIDLSGPGYVTYTKSASGIAGVPGLIQLGGTILFIGTPVQ